MNFIVTRAASTQISGLFSGFNQSQNNSARTQARSETVEIENRGFIRFPGSIMVPESWLIQPLNIKN